MQSTKQKITQIFFAVITKSIHRKNHLNHATTSENIQLYYVVMKHGFSDRAKCVVYKCGSTDTKQYLRQ